MGKEGHARALAETGAVMSVTAGIRRMGAASLDLAYVAAGRFDGFWEHGLQPWDIAAGILLLKEAGGVITDMHGGEQMMTNGQVVCANENLHPQLLKLLKNAKAPKPFTLHGRLDPAIQDHGSAFLDDRLKAGHERLMNF